MKEMVCKYCKDEFCVNDQCPKRADYCPVPDTPGVCKHEERVEVKLEISKLTPKECLIQALSENDVLRVDKVLNEIYETFRVLLAENGWEITEYCEEDDKAPHNNNGLEEEEWLPGQVVSIDEIATSNAWAFERKDNDSLTYITRDGLLIVTFNYGELGTIMLNRKGNGRSDSGEKKNAEFYAGQEVSIAKVTDSGKWTLNSITTDPFDTSCTYITNDRKLFVRFDHGKTKGIVTLCGCEDVYKIGQEVTLDEIKNSKDWIFKEKLTYNSDRDEALVYETRDGKLQVNFSDCYHGVYTGIIFKPLGAEKKEFEVGQRVHIGAIGASKNWKFVGHVNYDTACYESVDGTMSATFVDNSDWATIMRVK